mgnify:CR=1 FL=1
MTDTTHNTAHSVFQRLLNRARHNKFEDSLCQVIFVRSLTKPPLPRCCTIQPAPESSP